MLLFTEQLGERDASELMEGCDRPWPLWPLLCKESFTPTSTLLYYSKKIAHCEDVVHGDKPVIFVIRSYSSSSVPSALCQLFWQKHPSPWALHPYCHWHSNLSCESHLCPAALCCADPAWGGTDSGHQQLSTAGVSVPPTWSRSQFTYMIIFYRENREWSQETPKSILLTFHAGSISEDFRGTEVKLESTALFWCKRHTSHIKFKIKFSPPEKYYQYFLIKIFFCDDISLYKKCGWQHQTCLHFW